MSQDPLHLNKDIVRNHAHCGGYRTQAKLNKKKLRFKLSKVAYMGYILGSEGLQADLEKIQAIQNMPRPTDIHGVQGLIGVVTYLSKFVPQLSTICEPLLRLKESNSVFDWLPQHEDAFASIKELITQAPVLCYFDVSKEVTIKCDSSDVGLGAVLTQDGQPVAYDSHALTQTNLFKTNPHKPQMPSKDETLTTEVPTKGIAQAWPSNVHKRHSLRSCSPLASCQTRLT